MKHSGKAKAAGLKILFLTAVPVAVILLAGIVQEGLLLRGIGVALAGIWLLFSVFTMNFFRDPEARPPGGPNMILSPAHGTVDVIEHSSESEVMGGDCQRISIFLSVVDVHVQKAPLNARVSFLKHSPGQFLSAVGADSAEFNENVLLGFEATDLPGRRIGVRLIAGLIARRIVPWLQLGEQVARGERISIVQFGSRADVYLPMNAKINVGLRDKVVGGETVLATFE